MKPTYDLRSAKGEQLLALNFSCDSCKAVCIRTRDIVDFVDSRERAKIGHEEQVIEQLYKSGSVMFLEARKDSVLFAQ